jgi:hypothetical protein
MQKLSVNYSNKVWIKIKLLCTLSTELYYKTDNDAKEGRQYCLLTTVYWNEKYLFLLSLTVYTFSLPRGEKLVWRIFLLHFISRIFTE